MSLQDMIILQNKCEELEEKLAVAVEALKWLDEVIVGSDAEQVIREALERAKR